MLSLFRAFAKSPIALAIILLLVLGLVATGSGGIFTGSGNAVVVAGDEQVSVAEFRRAYDREFRRLQSENPSITREQAREFGLPDRVLQRLAVTAALGDKAEQLGIAVSPETVSYELAQLPAFRNPVTGAFDRDSMIAALQNAGMTSQEFGAQLENDLRQQQLVGTLAGGVAAPRFLAQTRYAVTQEQRRISALVLDASGADEIADPTDEQLEAFIAGNPDTVDSNGLPLFTAPEMRAITLVRFRLEDFIRNIEVDETVLRETYDYQVEAGQLGTPARRNFVQLTAADAQSAEAAAQRLAAGEDAAAIAADLGLEAPAVHEDVEAYEIPDTVLADAVFALSEGASEAVEGRFGWSAVRVTMAEDAAIPSFEEQLPGLREEAAGAEALDALYDQLGAFEQARAGGASLEEAAATSGSPIEVYAPLDQYGRDASLEIDMQRYGELGLEILPAAFGQIQGVPTDLEQYNETDFYALRVDEIIPSQPRPLAEVRDQAEARWRQIQLGTQLQTRADEALAQLQAGETLDIVALTAGGRPESTTVRRGGTAPNFPRNVVSRAFGLGIGEWATVQAGDGRYVVLTVDEIIPAETGPAQAGEIGTLADTLTEEISGDVLASLQGALEREYGLGGEAIDRRLFAIAMGDDPNAQQ